MSWFMDRLQAFQRRHKQLQRTVHEGFRYPLPKWGRTVMGGVYFVLPVIGGYYVMQWAISKSHASIGEHGERLPVKQVQGLGQHRVDEDGTVKIGAGGWGGGVRLADSDEETQRRNQKKLRQFMRKQQRQHQVDNKES